MSKNTRFKASSLYRRCLWLEYATLRWNVAGAAIVLIVALGTGSPAFADFRLDSAIEIAMVGQRDRGHSECLRARDQVGDLARAIEQGIMAVAVQMDEGTGAHRAFARETEDDGAFHAARTRGRDRPAVDLGG